MNYLIIGNGVAGTTAAETIRKYDADGKIIIFSREDRLFYSRIRLPDYIAGKVDETGIILKKKDWYSDLNIILHLNEEVSVVDPGNKTITTADGKTCSYDRLLLATGGTASLPTIPGRELPGVYTLRTLAEARKIRDHAVHAQNPALIGGGVLGLEIASSIKTLTNKEVIVVEYFDRLLPRQMDLPGATILRARLEEMGLRFFLASRTEEIIGADTLSAVRLVGGRQFSADLLIIAAGMTPDVRLAIAAEIKVEQGIVVNDSLTTSIPDIYAAGDPAQHRGMIYGIWPAAQKQGEVAGANMAGHEMTYPGTTRANTLKVAGIDLFSIGDIDPEGKCESALFTDAGRFIYQKFVFSGEFLAGAILLGDVRLRGIVSRVINNKQPVSEAMRKKLKAGNPEALLEAG